MFDFGNMFNGMFKPVARGACKMGMNGKVAVRTSSGYKTFDIKKSKLTNCDNFAFDMDGAFWVVPTFKVECGDIILVNGKPRCVIEVNPKTIKTFSYEDSTVDEVVPGFPKDHDLLIRSIDLCAVLLLTDLSEHPLAVYLHLAEQVLFNDLQFFSVIEHLSYYERHIVVHDLRHIILAYHLVYPLIKFDLSDLSDPFADDRNTVRIVLIILFPV